MAEYIPNTKAQREEMLAAIGLAAEGDLFAALPPETKLNGELDLPAGKSEFEVAQIMEDLAAKNKVYAACFRGAGAYRHYIPAIVKNVTGKDEFKTAYTPYQPELSQGILQSIFEYQTMICELTGMDVSNASLYDGGSAAAEAAMMCRDRRHETIYVAETANPRVRKVIETYANTAGAKVVTIGQKADHTVDEESLKEALAADSKAACFYLQHPNFYGRMEDPALIEQIVHGSGAKFIMACDPISLGILKSPGAYGADIAVGEGQPLGMPLAAGGPYLGYLAAKKALMRQLPGRIVGQTTDHDGRRAYVLTLQAREQHIRREKASSNVCSNQALCALTASCYLAAMGPSGLAKAAKASAANAHGLHDALVAAGLTDVTGGEFFCEFVTDSALPAEKILAALGEKGILGGLPIGEGKILWCATEVNTRAQIEQTAAIVETVLQGKGGEA